MTTDGIPSADPAAPGNFASEAKVQHTPGPWVNDVPNSNYVAELVDGVYHYIADCQPRNWSVTYRTYGEVIANARLIAAAPALLAALRDLMAIADPDGEATDIWAVTARAALAKATGI